MNKMFFKKSLVVILGLFLFSGTALAQINWTPPTGLPTGNNVPAPVNVGGASQTKEGNLSVDGNFRSGLPGTGAFFSENQSYLKGSTFFQEKSDGTGPNFILSFITAGFYNDVYIGNGTSSNPDLELQGRFKYVTKDDNGNIINPLNLEEMQDGGFDRILIGDENGNLRWGNTDEILNNNNGGGGGGGDLPTCADGQIIQYNNGVWGCVDPSTLGGGGGGNLPNGGMEGVILIWDMVNQEWKPTPKIRYVGGGTNTIEIDVPGFAGTTRINSTNIKIPLNGTAAPGKVLTAVDAQGTLGWAAAPTNDTADLPLGVGGQTLWFNGVTDAWEATNSMRYVNGQSTLFVEPNAYLQRDLYLKDIKSYDAENSYSSIYLPRLCVDKKGEDGVAGSLDDGKVYICPGENGFVYATPRDIEEGENVDNTDGTSSVEVQTNGNGSSTTYSWTVPAGITLLKQVDIVSGAGGGGGGGSGLMPNDEDSAVGGGGGGGGGGSGYKHTFYDVPVTPGETLCLVVGRGGEGGVGVSAYRNRSYNSTVLGVTSPEGDQLRAYPGQNGGDSQIGRNGCNNIITHNSLNLHIKGGGGGQGGYSVVSATEVNTRGGQGGEGGWPGYLVSNPAFMGFHGFYGTNGITTQDQQGQGLDDGRGGSGGQGGLDGLFGALGGVGGIVENIYNLRDINRDGSYIIGGNSGAEKAQILADHGKDYNLTDYDSHPGGGGGGGGAASGDSGHTDPPPTVEPGTCDDPMGFGTVVLGYVYEGDFYEINDYFPGDDPIDLNIDIGSVAVKWWTNFGIPQYGPCEVEVIDPPPYYNPAAQTVYKIDWNGDGDFSDLYSQYQSYSDFFPANTIATYNQLSTILKNEPSINLTDVQIDRYIDNLCTIESNSVRSIANGLTSCGGDGGRGGDGRIYIQY